MSVSSAQGDVRPARSERFHEWRRRKDDIARWGIAVGGAGVIGAIVLIFFYLLYVVFPLFVPAGMESKRTGSRPDWTAAATMYLAIEEQQEMGFRLDQTGSGSFFRLSDFSDLETFELAGVRTDRPVMAASSSGNPELFAVALESGGVLLLNQAYATEFDAGVDSRRIIPSLTYPFGEVPRRVLDGAAVTAIAVSENDTELLVVAADENGRVVLEWNGKSENTTTGEAVLDSRLVTAETGFRVSHAAISGNHRWLYLADETGRVHRFGLPTLESQQLIESSGSPVTAMRMLLGGISLLVGHADGSIRQMMPVRNDHNQIRLETIRQWTGQDSPIRQFIAEQRRKGFLALDDNGRTGIYHSTSERLVLLTEPADVDAGGIALSPRANGLLMVTGDGIVTLLEIDNPHPEVSLRSLWDKLWYENHAEPKYVWQSSAASNDFEPKFSLTPLAFGTLKAALYAMLFAVPLALLGAAYTAYFMAPRMRNTVKPTIEIMETFPTVIIGFLAGLWFAPFVEQNLAGVLSVLLLVPPAVLLFAWYWNRYEGRFKSLVRPGWEPVLLLPVVVILVGLAMAMATPIEYLFFDSDIRHWMSTELGISYDQRNALVVGCAMGFAVIPTIFSIAEDAIFSVPGSLSTGSLALGATPWQTLSRVILPTASPGIFSALMIGMGRAVGETMIVLMATGNTPVMDWNIFEGMRTLAANIAVEMPESEVASSHFRILFLAALVLFLFTFAMNTVAEIIRQRLRDKYSSL